MHVLVGEQDRHRGFPTKNHTESPSESLVVPVSSDQGAPAMCLQWN